MIEQEAVNLISTVGFPIAMCLILLYERFTDKKLLDAERKTENENTRKVIESNTEAMTELTVIVKERLK